MARFYTNENFPLDVVRELRKLNHDVLISLEAGQANRRIPDEDVLAFAMPDQRILLKQNRRDFLRLHNTGMFRHAGIVLSTAARIFLGRLAALANRWTSALDWRGN